MSGRAGCYLPPPPGTDRFPARPDTPSPNGKRASMSDTYDPKNEAVVDALEDYFDGITR